MESASSAYLCRMRKLHLLAMLLPVAGLAACDDFGRLSPDEQAGRLYWEMDEGSFTRASTELPDTNDFLLTIRDAGGQLLYDGSYGDSPAHMPVTPGSYTLTLRSLAFNSPAFSRPQYGDEQVVVVPAGQHVTARLVCTLQNAGVRLRIAPDFLTSYPDGVLYVKQGSTRLMYSYTEKRIVYVMPGSASVILYSGGKDQTLLTRELAAREILTVGISAPASGQSGSSLQVAVDTSKTWLSEQYVIGGDNSQGENSDKTVYNVSQAASHVGEKDVWLYGYVVGGDLSSAGASVKTSGITKATHLALAARSSVTEKASCVAVELPSGRIRENLNLVDHPELIGKRVYLRGDLVDAYFGTVGLKSTDDYAF